MNILSAERISKSYSEKILLSDLSLGIGQGDKIGLIGINGTGKSTLLKVVSGLEQPDSGNIIYANGITIGYLPQNPVFEDGTTVLEQVFKGNSPVMKLLREYEAALQEVNEYPDDTLKSKKLMPLSQRMDSLQAWSIESEAKTILTKLGICNFNADVATLSGGQRKRVAMAAALISPADLLILDEPTNHIDNTSVDWLEKYLNSRRGALLMVTHDRYFLGRVCSRIIELDRGQLYSYQANYDKYLEMKAQREELEQSSERKRRNLYRQELEWIRRGAKARSTKQKARIDRFEKLSEGPVSSVTENIEIRAGASRLGKKTIELEHVSKGFEGREIIHDFSYILSRDDRIGIIGPNGSGKSTLLKLIAGLLKPDGGSVDTGETVKVGIFSQENDDPDDSLRVIEYIRNVAEYLTTDEGDMSASQMLEKFLFPPSVQWTPVAKLSGGEKRRLYLLRVLMGAPNILLLDEPTNDLDIQTLTILESYLDGFPGAVVAVSHDRYFLDRTVDRIFMLEGDGNVRKYEGNYSYYYEFVHKEEKAPACEHRRANEDKDGSNAENKRNRPLKFTYKEQKEFEQIDEVIAGLEGELEELSKEMDLAASDFERLQELISRREAVRLKLDEAMEQWVYLNELAERIANGNSKGGSND